MSKIPFISILTDPTAGGVTCRGMPSSSHIEKIRTVRTRTAAKKIRIKRQTASGEPREIVVDYRKILSGGEPDVELEDGDLIIVKESFF